MTRKNFDRILSARMFVFAMASLAALALSAFDTPYLTFRSAASFSLSASKRWDGTLQKATGNPTDEASWSDWTGSSITAGLSDGQYYIYLRGKDNTTLNNSSYGALFSFSYGATSVYCEGDIETLRDYEGNPPAMAAGCCKYMFSGCTVLLSAPSLSATTLANECYFGMFKECSSLTTPPVLPAMTMATDCYRSMFEKCTGLKSLPSLPATTTALRCYMNMFSGCSGLEINTALPGVEWSIPAQVGSLASSWNSSMFQGTTGSFTGNPQAETPYYVASALPAGVIYQIGGKGTLDLALVGFSANVDLASTVKNGTAPYTFTLASGTLPPGLNVSGSTLFGTPTTTGNYSFSLSVMDAESHTLASAAYTMQVVQPTVTATTFVGADGAPVTTNCINLTTAITTLNQAWYVASGTLNFGTGGIKVSGDVNLVLADSASMTVQGASNKAGINVAQGNSLTIYGQTEGTGMLSATGDGSESEVGGAGIGGNDKESGGTITINGGTIVASAGGYAGGAGIGGGSYGNCGTITINNGTVTATGASYAAGIGGGRNGSGGAVTINGGTVTATAGSSGSGYNFAPNGIGQGYSGSSKGTLTVGPTMSVKAGSTANPTEEIGRGGLITIGTQRYFVVEKAGLLQTENALAAYANESKNWNLADTISGGTTSYSFTPVTGFEPPSGLTLSGTTLSGSVAAAGTYTIKYTVTDSSATPLVLEAVYTLTVTTPDPITAATNLTATVGKAKSFNIAETISGGVPPYSLAFSGTEPTGFSYNAGVLSGTATEANTYNFTITATDSLGTAQVLNYTLVTAESSGFTDDDPDEPASGDSVDCRTADGVVRSRTCNQITDSSTTVTWTDSWYYIAPNTTVTLSAGAIVSGKVSLILGDGATLTVNGASNKAGIRVVVEGSVTNSLTIYCQGAGTGKLVAKGGSAGAGIGGDNKTSGGTGLGDCGKVTIYGGVIEATGNGDTAGIGGGDWRGNGGTIAVYGGTVTATAGSSSGAGVGKGWNGDNGILTVGERILVKAGASANPTSVLDHGANGAITLSGERYYTFETTGPTPLAQTVNAFVAYEGDAFEVALTNTVSGGTPSYSFVQKSGTLPVGLTFSAGVVSGTPTAAASADVVFTVTDSGTGADAQSEDFTYTFTVTAKPKKITYYNGAVEIGGLTPTNYVEGTATTLAPTAPAAEGYAFAGWYDNAGLAGLPVTAISAVATGPQTFWAKFTPIEYTITYMDGATPMTGLTPTNYTIEAAATLPATATKAGYGFYGWYTNSTFTGSEVTTIPAGSTGNKTFYAKWGEVKVNTPYVDAYGNAMPQQLCAEVTSETTVLATGWYVVNGNVSIGASITVSGNVNLILADGSHLEVIVASGYDSALNVASGNSLTIYAQSAGTGRLDATGASSISSGIGGNSGESCGEVTINGGTIVATGGTGIGGGYQQAGGTVTINGGVVTAVGASGAGIGGGAGSSAGAGGTVTINGGTVTATGGYSGAGVGGGSSSVDQGTLTVASRVTVKAGSSANPTTVLNPNGETVLTSLLTGQRYFTFETVGPTPLVQTVSALVAYKDEATTLTFDGTVGGGTSPYTFTFKSGSLPAGISSTTFSGTPTETGTFEFVVTVADSGIGTDAQSADFTYTLTVTARPKPITYYNGAVEITGLTPSNYVEGVGAILPVTAPAEAGYELEGWYLTSACSEGDKVTAIGAEATGNQTFYAKWKLIEYTVTYMDGETAITDQNLTPTNYTVESATLNLPATATKAGKEFDGWYTNSVCTGDAISTIPHGSTGNKIFYAKWSAVKSNETYVDASGNSMAAVECSAVESDTTELATGWYVVKGNVTISKHVAVSGHAKLILADGATLTITSDNSYKAGINIPSYGSFTVYAQTAAGTGSLVVTGGALASGIGGEWNDSHGTITINGGHVTATAGNNGAGIGGGSAGAGGTVVINNGTITAVGGTFGAGIGGGYQGNGGTVTVNGGTVTAYSSGYGAGIGKGQSGSSNGSLTVGANMVVESGDDADSLTELGSGGAIALDGLKYYLVRKAGVAPLAQTASTYAIYVGEPFELALTNTVRGGSGSYSFTLKDGSSLPAWLTRIGDTLSGMPTAEGVTSFTFTVEDTVETTLADLDCTYTITASIRPTPIIYMDGSAEMTGLVPSNYIEGVGVDLPLTASKTGYLLLGWYTAANGGDRVYSISAEATGPQTVYAHWSAHLYSITYKDGNTTLTGLSPANYDIETATFNLPEPLAPEGKVFVGWYSDSGLNTQVTSIPQGSTGNKTFWVKWRDAAPGEGEMLVQFLDGDGTPREEMCKVMTSAMTTLDTGWYVVANSLTFNQMLTISNNVRIVLMDGKSLTVSGGSFTGKPGIWLAAGNSLTIYGQTGGTGSLSATADTYSNCAGIGTGYQEEFGTITINGGVITATGEGGAGIGAGSGGDGGTVVINRGTVTAVGGSNGAGIGGNNCNVTINGGNIEARGAAMASGIGGGYNQAGGTITITGGEVLAVGGNMAAGIGGGYNGDGGTVNITGGSVTATGGASGGMGIGGSSSHGVLTVGEGMKVYAGAGANPSQELDPVVPGAGRFYLVNNGTGPVGPTIYEIKYYDHYDEIRNLNPSNYEEGVGATLAIPEKAGYVFLGWYLDSNCEGERVYAIPANATGVKSFYSKWEKALVRAVVNYLDTDGVVKSVECTIIDDARKNMTNGWYAVTNNISFTKGMTVTNDVKLILADGVTLSVSNTHLGEAGVCVPSGSSLTIYGQSGGTGTLTATGGEGGSGAGIGGNLQRDGGTVTINGGCVTARGGSSGGAGIGGGSSGAAGAVTINGGTVTARGGAGNFSFSGAAGIGGGDGGSGSAVVINGGTVTAIGGGNAGGIGQGSMGESSGSLKAGEGVIVWAGASAGSAEMLDQTKDDGTFWIFGTYAYYHAEETTPTSEFTITYLDENGETAYELEPSSYVSGTGVATLPQPTRAGYTFGGWWTSRNLATAEQVTSIPAGSSGNKTLYARWNPVLYRITYITDPMDIDVSGFSPKSYYTGTVTALPTPAATKPYRVFESWYTNAQFMGEAFTRITADWTGDRTLYAKWEVDQSKITSVTFVGADGEQTENCFVLDTTVTELEDGWYVVTNDLEYATGLSVSGNVNLVLVDGTTLSITNGTYLSSKAGINVPAGSSLAIYGQANGTGAIEAFGANWGAAGIGGNRGEGCGAVTIYDVIVMATGGDGGAGIGGGYNGDGGTVVINGGEVSAYSINYGAGIGGGQSGSGGSVTINGGTVVATAEYWGAGIGGGYNGDGGTVTITGGVVTATSILGGAGIGKGNGGSVEVALAVGSGYGVYAGDEEDPISTFDVDGETGAVAITATCRYFVVKPATTDPEFRIVDGVLVEANLKGNTEITLPDTVTSIGAVVFRNNTSLESVVIPNSVKDIGDRAFQGCTALDSLTIGSGVTNITSDAFYGCTALTELAIPGNVAYIGEHAFQGCTSLATLTLGEGVKVIDAYAFYGCSVLTNATADGLYFPDSMEEIGLSAFVSCPQLAKVSLPGTMYVPGAPTSQAFYGTEVTYRTDEPIFNIINGTLVSVDTKGNASITIPGTVKEIGAAVFRNISTLQRVTIPSSVTNIATSAFLGCSNLVEAAMAEGLERIADGAFENCTSLTNVTIPASAVVVGRQSFRGCTGLETATILAGDIGSEAFSGCTNLATLVLGSGVTGIGDSAFRGCTPLTSVTIPGSVAEVGSSAFWGCSNIVSLTIAAGADKTIGDWAFYSCSSLATLTLGEGITNIAESAFKNCKALTALAIPDSVEAIGDLAFSGCDMLATLTFGSGLKTIGAEAFDGCSSLENDVSGLYFPDSLESIGTDAFRMCNNLTKVSLPGSQYANGTIHPVFDYWQTAVDYRGVAPVFYVDAAGQVRSVALKGATNITIPTTVRGISIGAFAELQAIESVTIPSCVTNIGQGAFRSCSNLVSVAMSAGLQAIGENAFMNCTSLTSVTIPDSVTKVDAGAFWACSSLESATLGSGVTIVPDYMFTSCSALESVTFRGNVTDIGQMSFWKCSALEEVSFTDSLSHIGRSAFADCTSITTITIPKGVAIDMGAFSHCTSLAFVNISGEVRHSRARSMAKGGMLLAASGDPNATTVGDCVFLGCSALEEAMIGSTVEEMGGGVFAGCSRLNTITVDEGNDNFKAVDGLFLTKDGTTLISAFGEKTTITVPDSVVTVADGAFAEYATLSNVTLSASVVTIGAAAFSNCTVLATATIPSNVTSIAAHAFYGTALATVYVSKGDTAHIRGLVEGTGYLSPVTYIELGDEPVVTEDWPETPSSVEGQTAAAAFGITGELANAQADDLATWAKAKGVDFSDRGTIIPNAFLLNCANNAAAVATATEEAEEAIEITAITVVNGVPQLTYPATYGNGQVVIQGSATIGASASWHDGQQTSDRFFRTVLKFK